MLVILPFWWVMSIARSSRNRWWVGLGAIATSALATVHASNCETTANRDAAAPRSATNGSPKAPVQLVRVALPFGFLHADYLAAIEAAYICNTALDGCFGCRAIAPAGASSTAVHPVQEGRSAPPIRLASRSRTVVLRLHGGSIACWGGRGVANLKKELLGSPEDDETSDDPTDDDDGYDDLNAYDDSDVPFVARLPELVPFLFGRESAPRPGFVPPDAPFSTLQRLRC